MKVVILTESELRKAVTIDRETVAVIEDVFGRLAAGKVNMPAIMHIEVPDFEGDVDIKSAYVQGLESFAVKIGAGFFNNYRMGLPNSPAMMVVISAKTGMAEAILLDNAYLTDVRTGAAGAVAAKHLAPEIVDTAGQIGTGAQGRYQMTGLKTVRDFKRILANCFRHKDRPYRGRPDHHMRPDRDRCAGHGHCRTGAEKSGRT